MITFVDYQYKGIGGVGQIVVNTTLELNRRGLQAKIYCSSDSYEYLRLKECNADFIHINSDIVTLRFLSSYLSAEDIIFLTHKNNTKLLGEIRPLNNKLLFYSVHPETFFTYWWVMDILMNQKNEALKFINTLLDNKALFFMDGANVKSCYERGLAFRKDINFLPVPVISYLNLQRKSCPKNVPCITYLGRGNDDWKIYPIIKVLEDLNTLPTRYKIVIITDLNSKFQEAIYRYLPDNKVEIEFQNNLSGEKLERFLYQNSWIHFAMGTSALEAAKIGIPTIELDFSNHKFPAIYRYRWLFESIDYSLGGEIIDNHLPYKEGTTLENILTQVSTEKGYKEISEQCKLYTEKNHSIHSFVDILLKACEQTEMTTRMYYNTKYSKNMLYIKPLLLLARPIVKSIKQIRIIWHSRIALKERKYL